MTPGKTARTIRNLNFYILHHALILVIENVTMQDIFTNVALITGAYLDRIHRRRKLARKISWVADQVLYTLQARILRVDLTPGIINCTKKADVVAARVKDRDE
jgi:hypothetical protein